MSIATSNPCPRVPVDSLPEFQGKRIRLVGKVQNVSGSTMSIQCDPDNERSIVEVLLMGTAPTDAYCEVEGVVEGTTIREDSPNVGLGNDFGTLFWLLSSVPSDLSSCVYVCIRQRVNVWVWRSGWC